MAGHEISALSPLLVVSSEHHVEQLSIPRCRAIAANVPAKSGVEFKSYMSQRIYVGNLPYSSSEEEVEQLFGQYGEVISCALPTDRETGRPRGFGFVEMSNEDASKAIEALDGTDFGGRSLAVSEARPRQDRGPRGGGGGGYGGGGGGGYGGGRDRRY